MQRFAQVARCGNNIILLLGDIYASIANAILFPRSPRALITRSLHQTTSNQHLNLHAADSDNEKQIWQQRRDGQRDGVATTGLAHGTYSFTSRNQYVYQVTEHVRITQSAQKSHTMPLYCSIILTTDFRANLVMAVTYLCLRVTEKVKRQGYKCYEAHVSIIKSSRAYQ